MLATPLYGIRYAEATDHTRLWEHFQGIAEDVEKALVRVSNTRATTGDHAYTSGTLSTDSQLQWASLPVGRYRWFGQFMLQSGASDADLSARWSGAGVTYSGTVIGPAAANTGYEGPATFGNVINSTTGLLQCGVPAQETSALTMGVLTTTSVGTLVLQFAKKNAASGYQIVLRAGSWVTLERIG